MKNNYLRDEMKKNKFHPFPILETERLTLRRFFHADREVIFLLRSDERVIKYIKRPAATDIAEADAHITRINTYIDEGVSVAWAICIKGKTKCIGTICLWNFSEDQTVAEVGYDLVPDFHGKGIMREALKAVLDYAFNTLHLKFVEAFTDKDNAKSIALLEKNGFRQQPERRDEGNLSNGIYSVSNPLL